jgi:hypothetical protein
MPRFLANWEVESDLILPEGQPFVRHDHPAGTYTAFLRNIPGTRNEHTFLSMQFIFMAPELKQAKALAEEQAKEFIDYLAFASSLKIRLRNLLQIWNWEQPGTFMRECLYWSSPTASSDAPFEALDGTLLETLSLLQAHPSDSRLRRALKWYANGIASPYRDDQFVYFWFVVEVVAQITKEPARVPDKCPTCRTPLYCETSGATPLHRPYPKQAIEQLFARTITDQSDTFYRHASEARNRLMHGDEVHTIEASLQVDFTLLVNTLGRFAWTVLFNQFASSMVGKNPMFLQPNQYVAYNLSGVAHVQFGFVPNFDNPDPAHFPKMEISYKMVPRAGGEGEEEPGPEGQGSSQQES